MKKLLAAFLVLVLLLPSGVIAQDDGLEQKYADENFSFSYPVGWQAISTPSNAILVTPSRGDIASETPDVLMLSFVKPNNSSEDMATWPLNSDLVFLVGYITSEVVTGVVEKGERVTYREIETSTINENEFVSVTFEGQSMSGNVTAIEHGDQRLFAVTFGTPQTFVEQEDMIKRIIQSVEFKG